MVKGRVTATDKDRDPLTYGADALSAKGGTVVIDDRGRFTYAPTAAARHAASATGAIAADKVDTFIATVDDGQGHIVPVAVTVRISAVNTKPTANGSVGQPNPVTGVVTGKVTATDQDNDALTYTATAPRKGSVVLNSDGTFTYTPTAAARETARKTFYADTDKFRVTVDDGHGGVKTVALTATIAPAQVITNNPPVATNDSYSTAEDTALTVAGPGVLGNDTDPEGTTLTAALVSGAAHGTVTVNPNGSFTYTPTANFNGADSFTYKASDGTASSAAATVSITVTAVNDAPVATNDAYSTAQGTALTVAGPGVLGNDTDPEGTTLTAALVSGAAHGTVTVNANGSFTYTPTANYNGADSFTYKASDGTASSAAATVSITVTPVNGAPVGVGDSYTTAEDTVLTVSAPGVLGNDTDPEGTTLTAALVSGAAHGTVTVNANGSFTYTPTANFNGADSFTYKASDGTASSAAATVSITVTAVNDAPVATNNTYSTAEDTALTVAGPGVLGNDTDAEGTTLTAALVSGAAHGTVSVNPNGSFTYTPTANYNGADSFTYKASDGTASSAAATVSITVTAVNDAPVATNDTYSTAQGTALTVAGPGVLGNDTDVEGTTLTAALVSGAAHGTVSVNANGSFTYTPTANYNGADSFTYKASDGSATSAAATVSLTVTPIAVSPSTVGAPDYSVIVGATGTRYQVTSDFNPATGVPTATRVSVVNADGKVLSTTGTIAGGIGIAAPVARPNGTLVLATYDQPNNTTTVTSVSTSGIATTLGTAQGVAYPLQVAADGTIQALTASIGGTAPTFGVLTVSADNTVHAYAIDGTILTLPQLAPDGSFYLVVAKQVAAAGTSTARLVAVAPDGTTRLSPTVTTGGTAQTGGVAIASDGTAYASFSVPNLQTNTFETTIVTATASTMTTRIIPNTAGNGLLVAGGLGAVYLTLQNGATLNGAGNSVSIAKITAGDIALTTPVPGVATSFLVYGAAGTTFVNITDQLAGKNSVLVRLETGEAYTVVIPGDFVTYQSGVGQGTIISTGGTAHTYVPYTQPLADGGEQTNVAVLTFTGTVGQNSVMLPIGATVNSPVVFNSTIPYTPYQVVTNGDGTTSVVNLTSGATTAPVPGQPFNGGDVAAGIASPVYFSPNGFGYLLTTDNSGPDPVVRVQEFNDTTPTGGGFTGISASGSPLLTAPRVSGQTSITADPIVFAPGGSAYVAIQNGTSADPHPSVTVYEITPNGATKVLDEEDAIGSPVTVAPDGTVYVSIGKLNAAGDDYVTTVQVLSSPVVV